MISGLETRLFLSSVGKSSSETIGNAIVKTDQLLEKTNPMPS